MGNGKKVRIAGLLFLVFGAIQIWGAQASAGDLQGGITVYQANSNEEGKSAVSVAFEFPLAKDNVLVPKSGKNKQTVFDVNLVISSLTLGEDGEVATRTRTRSWKANLSIELDAEARRSGFVSFGMYQFFEPSLYEFRAVVKNLTKDENGPAPRSGVFTHRRNVVANSEDALAVVEITLARTVEKLSASKRKEQENNPFLHDEYLVTPNVLSTTNTGEPLQFHTKLHNLSAGDPLKGELEVTYRLIGKDPKTNALIEREFEGTEATTPNQFLTLDPKEKELSFLGPGRWELRVVVKDKANNKRMAIGKRSFTVTGS